MKKTTIFLLLICSLFLTCCKAVDSIDRESPVFETENINSVILFSIPHNEQGVNVPNEYMEEIIKWIGTFRLDRKAEGMLDPGTNTISIRIEYSDGTSVESGVNTIDLNGVTYHMTHERAPKSLDELLSKKKPFGFSNLLTCSTANNSAWASPDLEITKVQAEFILDVWEVGMWENDIAEAEYDYVFRDGNVEVRYSYDDGIFNDVTNNKHLILSSSLKAEVNKIVDRFIVLPVVD